MSRTRRHFEKEATPHFITCTVVGWLPVFTRPEAVKIVFDSMRFMHEERGVEILGYVVMENHLHMIAGCENLGEKIMRFKSFTARSILDLLMERKERSLLEQIKREKTAA